MQADVSTAGPRIRALDTLRGFALCGILIINIYQQVVWHGEAAGKAGQLPEAVRLLCYERFYPIFAILFGIGFGSIVNDLVASPWYFRRPHLI